MEKIDQLIKLYEKRKKEHKVRNPQIVARYAKRIEELKKYALVYHNEKIQNYYN